MGESNFSINPFVSLEGGLAWNTIDGYNYSITGTNLALASTEKNDGFAARLALGMISMWDDQFGLTGEVAWGYYGKSSYSPTTGTGIAAAPVNLTVSNTLTGFDALFGISYIQTYFTLSGKIGAMIQNMSTKSNASIAPFGFPLIDTLEIKTNKAAVLPEIKLGAAYNVNENWAITGSYLVAFGASPKTTGNLNLGTLRASLNVNDQNPTINAALFGVQYTA
jgi:hypothetical protein